MIKMWKNSFVFHLSKMSIYTQGQATYPKEKAQSYYFTKAPKIKWNHTLEFYIKSTLDVGAQENEDEDESEKREGNVSTNSNKKKLKIYFDQITHYKLKSHLIYILFLKENANSNAS